VIFAFAIPAAAGFLAAVMNRVHCRPRTTFGFFF
jgi:hypothetical protein